MDAALPPAADEGCCLDTETSRGGDTEFFQHAPDDSLKSDPHSKQMYSFVLYSAKHQNK